jgi:glycine cleavage system transcriptional repressor
MLLAGHGADARTLHRVNELAVTVIGHDRPGIVADVAEVLARLGLNLTDSTMTRLRGHFAMTLICTGDAPAGQVEEYLRPLWGDSALLATVWQVRPEAEADQVGTPYLVSLHGADRLGIVAAVTRVLARAGGNITDLTTRLIGPLYVLVAEVDLPPDTVDAVAEQLAGTAAEFGVEVTFRPGEMDVL